MPLSTPKLFGAPLFRETLASYKSVADNGGYITGVPVINNGFTGDGTSKYISYPPNRFQVPPNGTIVMRDVNLSPTYVNQMRVFTFSHSGGGNYSMRTYYDGTTWYIYFPNGTTVAAVNCGAVATGTTHTIHVSWTWDGVNTVFQGYLDGVAVGGTTSLAGRITQPDDHMAIGEYGVFFKGTVREVAVYAQAMTASDVQDDYQQDTYTEVDMGKAVVSLPLKSWYYDGSSIAVTDNIGSKGGTMNLGDGTTTTKFPTKLSPHGMSFDGGDYLEMADAAAIRLTTTGSIGGMFYFPALPTAASWQLLVSKINFNTGRNGYCLYYQGSDQTIKGGLGSGSAFISIGAAAKLGWHSYIFTWDGTNLNLYIDGVSAATPVAQSVTPVDGGYKLIFGADTSYSLFLDNGSKAKHPFVFDFAINGLQARYLHNKMMTSLNV